jgi:hypothetical protein
LFTTIISIMSSLCNISFHGCWYRSKIIGLS